MESQSEKEGNYEENNKQQTSQGQGPASGQVKHRRKKNEIEKDYICGDASCGRRYGTNAALYTHIKNKHGGVPPVGTIKPTSSQKKALLEQQQTAEQSQSVNHQSVNKSQQHAGSKDDEEEKALILETTSNPHFNNFALMIAKLGSCDKDNLFVRRSSEEYYSIKDSDVQQLFEMVIRVVPEPYRSSPPLLNKTALQFLVHMSSFWRKTSITELYGFLIFAYIMKGQHFEVFQSHILTDQKNQIISKLVQSDMVEVVRDVYQRIWRGVIEDL